MADSIGYRRPEENETPIKQTVTQAEKFYGSPDTQTNNSMGIGLNANSQLPSVDPDADAETDELYRQSYQGTFEMTDTVMEYAKELDNRPVPKQEVFNKVEKMTPDTTNYDEFITQVQTEVSDPTIFEDATEEEFLNNPTMETAGGILRDFFKGHGAGGTDAEYALQLGTETYSNLGGAHLGKDARSTGGLAPMVIQAINSDDPKVINALMYTIEMYDRKEWTGRGLVDGLTYMLGDLGLYFGGTSIYAKGASKAGGGIIKQGFITQMKSKLKELSKTKSAKAIGAGATYSAKEEFLDQYLKMESGLKGAETFDAGKLAEAMGYGAVFGLGLVKIPDALKWGGTKSKDVYEWLKRGIESEAKGVPYFTRINPQDVALATKGDKEAQRRIEKSVFGDTYTLNDGVSTGSELQPVLLEKLQKNPNMVEDLAKSYGFEFEYFTAVPENIGNKVGGKTVKKSPVGNKALKKQGYDDGKIWVYDPTDTHGAFKDPEYTKAWRQVHELSHALTEKYMQQKYGDSKRFGAMGIDRKNPYSKTDKKTYKGLSLAESQRAIEWEEVAFRTQNELLRDMGMDVTPQQAIDDWNIASSDSLVRTVTGDFSNPSDVGVKIGVNDKPLPAKEALQFLQDHEAEMATSQNRKPTKGIDLENWSPISDKELRSNIDSWKKTTSPENVTVSVESMPSTKSTDVEFNTILNENPKLAESYHEQMTTLTDEILSDSGLKNVVKHDNAQGVWEGKSNLVTQYDIPVPKGGTTPEFQKQINDTAEEIATVLQQDGVGWHIPTYVKGKEGEVYNELNGVELNLGKKVSPEDMIFINDELEVRYGEGYFITPTDSGLRVIDYTAGNGYNKGKQLYNDVGDIAEDLDDDMVIDLIQFNANSDTVKGNVNGNSKTNGVSGKESSNTQKSRTDRYSNEAKRIREEIRGQVK